MKIIKLYSKNIKKLKAVEITPDGDTVIISGKNAQGKSSVMDSIAMALGGKKLIPDKPVRDGEETALIEVDIGDYKISRNWTNPTTSYLKITNKDGAKISNGQSILNAIIGDLSFDPLDFANKEAKEQADDLAKITGLDFTELKQQHDAAYTERRYAKRDLDSLKARLDSFGEVEEVELANVDDIRAAKERAKSANEAADKQAETRLQLKSAIERGNNRIAEIETEVEALEQEGAKVSADVDDLVKKLDGIPLDTGDRHDLSVFDMQLEDYYQAKANQDKIAERAKLNAEVDKKQAIWSGLDEQVKSVLDEKQRRISEAKMPVDGLSLGTGEVLFNGMPFNQLSMAEKIKVSIGIAASNNPKLRIAMIYNGSLLDDDALVEVSKMAADLDIQLWIEKVANSKSGNELFIEDGALT